MTLLKYKRSPLACRIVIFHYPQNAMPCMLQVRTEQKTDSNLVPRMQIYASMSSTGGREVCGHFLSTPSIGLKSPGGLSLVSCTAMAGRSGLCP